MHGLYSIWTTFGHKQIRCIDKIDEIIEFFMEMSYFISTTCSTIDIVCSQNRQWMLCVMAYSNLDGDLNWLVRRTIKDVPAHKLNVIRLIEIEYKWFREDGAEKKWMCLHFC